MKVSSSMEVVNFNDENGNREKFINTKVFVIDKMGKVYTNGIIDGPLRHRDYLLEIANFLYPDNEIATHIDEGNVSENKISPFNVAYFFNMMGYTVILNSPSMEGVKNMPKYICILEASSPSEIQRESLRYCLTYFSSYCTDYATGIVAKFISQMHISWNTITFDGIPNVNPFEAYESYLKESQEKSPKLNLTK